VENAAARMRLGRSPSSISTYIQRAQNDRAQLGMPLHRISDQEKVRKLIEIVEDVLLPFGVEFHSDSDEDEIQPLHPAEPEESLADTLRRAADVLEMIPASLRRSPSTLTPTILRIEAEHIDKKFKELHDMMHLVKELGILEDEPTEFDTRESADHDIDYIDPYGDTA
jgi:hypothetical protein